MASSMCIHMMASEGTATVRSGNGTDSSTAVEEEDLLKQQNLRFQKMLSAHKLLKQLSPKDSQMVAYELTRIDEHLSKTRANLEKKRDSN